tara:strand:- start:3233 stop:4456 length:1224 start_codon:yes stop_codon:yes gene_type:complete
MKSNILVIGLGYVGLPLALSLSKYYNVFGFDISKKRVNELKRGYDCNKETSKNLILKSKIKFFYDDKEYDYKTNVFIVTVPTPVNAKNKPNLKSLISACKFISKKVKKNDLIIIESTIAPGTTENYCLKLISKGSKVKKKDLNICFSPERINPGDKINNLNNLVKIISGNSKKTIKLASKIYEKITKKVLPADSIKSAELAKIVENAQRDLNISFMNEVYKICDLYKLNYKHVLSLCKTKWNFINFHPGLVGGHCVPVDPYYLIDAIKKKGFKSELIEISRKVNENFVNYISTKILKIIKPIKNKNILFHGINFKDNVFDRRNSKFDLIYKKIKKIYYSNLILLDDIKYNKKFNSEKYNILIIGSKNLKTQRIINNFKKNKNSNKILINIFGNIKLRSNKKLLVLNL